jgi:hypothetical protein
MRDSDVLQYKERMDKNLYCLSFALFALFRGNSFLVAASAALGSLWFISVLSLSTSGGCAGMLPITKIILK